MLVKKITLEPEFKEPKISTTEQVYKAIKAGNHSYVKICESIGRRRGGGGVSDALKDLISDGWIEKRKCSDCGLHWVYHIINKS